MPIPPLNEHGVLPVVVHDCVLDEIKLRFGSFQRTDRRPQLFAKLALLVDEAVTSRVVSAIVVDGSFVTAETTPNDIDLIMVVFSQHDFTTDLAPAVYKVLSKQMVHRRFGFDLLAARDN